MVRGSGRFSLVFHVRVLYALKYAVVALLFILQGILADPLSDSTPLTGHLSSFKFDTAQSPVISAASSAKKQDSVTVAKVDRMVVTANRINAFTPSKVILNAKSFSGKYTDLQSVLETVSGVVVCNTGGFGHYADASIRGSSASQVQVYIDGIPQNGASGNAVDISKIPIPSLQSIEICKSLPPIEYFGDNAGGVILLTTDATKDATSSSMEIGSYGYRQGSAIITKTLGPMVHRLSVNYGWADNNYPYTDSIITRGPTVANDDSVKIMDNNSFSTFSSMYANTYTINDRSKLTSQFSSIITNEGIFYLPQAGKNDGTIKNSKFALVESYRQAVNPNLTLTLTAKAQTEDEHFQRFQPFYLSMGPVLHDISQPFASLEATGKTYLNRFCTITGLASTSYNGFDYTNLLAPTDQAKPHYSRVTGKAGLEADFTFQPDFSARIGGIYRYEKDSTNDSMTKFGAIIPGGSTTKEWFPGGFSEIHYRLFDSLGIVAGVQYSCRSPGFSEKYSEGANVSGNAELRPETRLEYNLGFSFLRPPFALSSSIFTSDTKDKIIYTMTSHMFVPNNISDVNGYGLECDIVVAPWKWLSIGNSATYMINSIKSDVFPSWNGKDEPLLPRFSDNLSVKISYHNFYASHSAKFSSSYFTNYDNLDTIRQDKPQLNAGIGCTFGPHFDLSYRIENYLNVQDYDFQRPLPGITQYIVFKMNL